MSRRTSEANKAIATAWNNEKQLVCEGKGTRNWTQEQQQDILDKGKAYDDNGRAFEGQHMKSVEKYPEYQGDPKNIQFLTKQEHLEAHQGSWLNPTNWYFDPSTKQITDFGESKYVPCLVIDLSEPIHSAVPQTVADSNTQFSESSGEDERKSASVGNSPPANRKSRLINTAPQMLRPQDPVNSGGFWISVKNVAKGVSRFCTDHVDEIIMVGLAIGKAYLDSKSDSSSSSRSNRSSSSGYSYTPSTNFDSFDDTDDFGTLDDGDYPSTHAAPCDHMVKPHGQHYGKNKIWKEKDAYPRGGKHKDDD